jgi:hypothetical protein
MALSVTRRALVALKDVLDQRDAVGSRALRLTAGTERKLAFLLDVPREDDVIVGLDDANVLIMEPHLNSELDGLTLDLRETSDGPVWILTRRIPGGARREP